jgi:hypothetical protein
MVSQQCMTRTRSNCWAALAWLAWNGSAPPSELPAPGSFRRAMRGQPILAALGATSHRPWLAPALSQAPPRPTSARPTT